jgi:AraC-like DNA-binding protein
MRLLGTADLDILEQLFDKLPDSPFFVKDAALRYVSANAAMARLCRVGTTEALVGKSAANFFPRPQAERYESWDRQVLANGRPITDRLDLATATAGDPVWLLFTRVPIRDLTGVVVGVAGASRRLSTPSRSDATYSRLAHVIDHIRGHYDEPLNLSGLAARAGISKSQLERDFTALFGTTLQAFLHRTRMEQALRRLEGDASVAQVAHECGYADHSAFTRRFHSIVGLSPRQYRQRLRQNLWGKA